MAARLLAEQHEVIVLEKGKTPGGRCATPRTIWPEPCWVSDSLALAGDAFAGPRIEGAAVSGLAAATAILSG